MISFYYRENTEHVDFTDDTPIEQKLKGEIEFSASELSFPDLKSFSIGDIKKKEKIKVKIEEHGKRNRNTGLF
jgi:hypothetical protein